MYITVEKTNKCICKPGTAETANVSMIKNRRRTINTEEYIMAPLLFSLRPR
jgi:hypothetical protein